MKKKVSEFPRHAMSLCYLLDPDVSSAQSLFETLAEKSSVAFSPFWLGSRVDSP